MFEDSSPANREKYYPLLERTRTHNELYYLGLHEKDQFLGYLNPRLPDRRLLGLGVERAVEIALRNSIALKIAGKVCPEDREYFLTCIAPHLRHDRHAFEFIGELTDAQKGEFLGDAQALLFPIDWPEPFGLVMVEALAFGTPVMRGATAQCQKSSNPA